MGFLTLHGSGPPVVPQSRFEFVVLRLSARWPPNGRVGKVHVRRHGAGISWTTWLRIVEIIHRPRRRNATVRRRGPAQTRHVRTSANTVGPVIAISRRFKWLRGRVARGVRCHRWSLVRRTAEARERRRCGCRRGARTGLREITPNVRRNRSIPHVVVASRTRHIQRW